MAGHRLFISVLDILFIQLLMGSKRNFVIKTTTIPPMILTTNDPFVFWGVLNFGLFLIKLFYKTIE